MTAATLGTRFPISRDLRVIPFRAADLDRPIRCHTRVQEMEVGGQVSNVVQLNLKSGEITPYWTGSASTWVPVRVPTPLDSARYEIGQLSSGVDGCRWTVPRWKSDSCPVGRCRAAGDGERRPERSRGEADLRGIGLVALDGDLPDADGKAKVAGTLGVSAH